MAQVTLYSARACPFAHRTRLVLAHKHIDFTLEEIDLQNKPSWFSSVSAYGKVPAISHAGLDLWESAVVNEYLDEVFPEPALLPRTAGARAQARIWIDYANTRFVGAFGALLRSQSEQEANAARGVLLDSLRFIESEGLKKLGTGGPYFLGAEPSLIDFTFYPWFERWGALTHYRGFAVPSELARVHAWRAAVAALPAVKAHENATAYYVERYARYAAPAQPPEVRA